MTQTGSVIAPSAFLQLANWVCVCVVIGCVAALVTAAGGDAGVRLFSLPLPLEATFFPLLVLVFQRRCPDSIAPAQLAVVPALLNE